MTKLIKYLKREGLSRFSFAVKVGVTPSAIHNIVTGKSTPSLMLAFRIEEETDGEISAEYFYKAALKKIPKGRNK
ncbi:MAG: hypothetical protein DRQ88_09240 [Epsilonproteobacteria bacterium]|nr:MAG: hypothetical protein DRQ88_09240 [Campylobacterota bacterium]